jgi:glycine/D-amino acid oxidase-like deaminating enzyme
MAENRILTNPTAEHMPKTADVVIIGGGPAGCGALWALERAQPGIRAVLIERGRQLGSGASNASLENFRTAWNARCNAVMMARSIEVFHNPQEYFGEGARARVYLFCGFTEKQAAKLRADVEHLHSIGLTHAEYLDAEEVQSRFGWLGDKVIAGKYDPKAGWLDSYALVMAMAGTARNAVILQEIQSVSIMVSGGRVTGVSTPNGVISSPNVIIANGAHRHAPAAELHHRLAPRRLSGRCANDYRRSALPACAAGSTDRRHLRLGILVERQEAPCSR